MPNRLKTVLLIDDNDADNYLHRRAILKLGCVDDIRLYTDAEAALAYLNTCIEGRYPRPDLIFLDINMPGMDGWEFLEAYEALPAERRGKALLMMLSTSLNPDDQQRAEANPRIRGFLNKPLNTLDLSYILRHHFGWTGLS
jgi:CheY-like chemotaxis protein